MTKPISILLTSVFIVTQIVYSAPYNSQPEQASSLRPSAYIATVTPGADSLLEIFSGAEDTGLNRPQEEVRALIAELEAAVSEDSPVPDGKKPLIRGTIAGLNEALERASRRPGKVAPEAAKTRAAADQALDESYLLSLRNAPAYFFGSDLEGNNFTQGDASMKDLLGGKGANIAQMAKLTYEIDGKEVSIRVPPGFTVTTEEAKRYFDNNEKLPEDTIQAMRDNLAKLERATGRELGGREKPLLVSVRSGAAVSMPGMMDTILNIGLNDETVKVLAEEFGNARFAWDSYRRLIMMFGDVVLGLGKEGFDEIFERKKRDRGVKSDIDLKVDDLKEVVFQFKEYIGSKQREFPQNPWQQLIMAVEAVFKSSNNERAIAYRRINKIPPDTLSAANVQTMVFGNLNDRSATGVAFTRNPATGKNEFYGECLFRAQGEDIVAGVRTPMPLNRAGIKRFVESYPEFKGRQEEIRTLEDAMPEVYKELVAIYQALEAFYKDMQDIEFTIQDGVLYMLQTRSGQRTAMAALNILMDLYYAGVIDEKEAVMRLSPAQTDQFLHPVFRPEDKARAKAEGRVLTKGLAPSPGASVGEVVFNSAEAEELSKKGRNVILVRRETSAEDVGGMKAAQGILTAVGGETSHAAVVARGMGKTAVVGAGELVIDEKTGKFRVADREINKGDIISIDGYTGEVILGEVKTMDSVVLRGKKGEPLDDEEKALYERFVRFFEWVDEYRAGVRTNAETPDDVTAAIRYFGADGIGLARTEHMFFRDRDPGENRILKFRRMIIEGEIDQAVFNELSGYQKEDFKDILRIVDGRPITIRLLDPPLHEFLPKPGTEEGDEAIRELSSELGIPEAEIITTINSMKETNPMAGYRGDRLLMVYPEIAAMQVRAIFNAYKEIQREGIKVAPVEIMIPLIGVAKEFEFFEEMIEKIADEKKFRVKRGKDRDYLIGTMIEVPSAAITADEIARHADFFSFGTNDLTQFTFKFSRDDAGNIVIPVYLREDVYILKVNPFVTIDEVVGELVRIATALGRKANPELKVGICGEQGGDPESIEETIIPGGLDYASCSPYRVPGAKLASAQKLIKDRREKRPSFVPYDLERITAGPVDVERVEPIMTEEMMTTGDRIELMRRLILKDIFLSRLLGPGAVFLALLVNDIKEFDNNAFIRLFNQDMGSLFKDISDSDIRALARNLKTTPPQIKKAIDRLHELNPALGNRGVRQALTGYDEIFRIQLEAIILAMKKNKNFRPRIVVPLLIDHQEFKMVDALVTEIAEKIEVDRERISLGACIETPRAALQAGEIAKIADFIIFDTLGLTESSLAITKEDAGSFMPEFVRKGIYEKNPLEDLPHNVDIFINIAVKRADEVRPGIPVYYFGTTRGPQLTVPIDADLLRQVIQSLEIIRSARKEDAAKADAVTAAIDGAA